MLDDRGSFQDIADDLIKRCGGAERLTPADFAIVRQLAVLLSAPTADPASARIAVDLQKLVPLQRGNGAPLNLDLISYEQLRLLDEIPAIARGKPPATREPASDAVSGAEYSRLCRELEAERF